MSWVVADDDLLPAALELAETIAANPPLAVQALKRGLREALDPNWDDLGRWVSSSLAELFRTDDHREGVAAFLEKRDPTYTATDVHLESDTRCTFAVLRSVDQQPSGDHSHSDGRCRGGIGVYIAKVSPRKVLNLSLTARSADELEAVRNEIEAMGVRAIATVGDAPIAHDRGRPIQRTEAELGLIDILVNNAAIDIVLSVSMSTESRLRHAADQPRSADPADPRSCQGC